jgi:RNA polymerase sigma-70 factor, ECF subfamily
MDQKTEADIIARVLGGERQAYSLLVEEYKGPIYNLAFRMTRNLEDADDLAQETFLQAYRKMGRFDRRKIFFTWLYTIGLNIIRNHLKKKLRESKQKTDDRTFQGAHGAADNGIEGNLAAVDEIVRLEDGLQELPVDLREAVILRFYQELSFEEISAVSGASVSAVKMRVYRGIERLKKLMGNDKM